MTLALNRWHQLVFRAVEGAYENARAAHPKWPADPRLARSVAKRAAGTLTAITRDALAQEPPASDDASGTLSPPAVGFAIASTCPVGCSTHRAEWRKCIKLMHRMVAEFEQNGEPDRAQGARDAAAMAQAAFNRLYLRQAYPPTTPT